MKMIASENVIAVGVVIPATGRFCSVIVGDGIKVGICVGDKIWVGIVVGVSVGF